MSAFMPQGRTQKFTVELNTRKGNLKRSTIYFTDISPETRLQKPSRKTEYFFTLSRNVMAFRQLIEEK